MEFFQIEVNYVRRKLSKLKKSGRARLEYQCSDCGYIFYRPLIGEDIDVCLKDWDTYSMIICPSCSTRTLELIALWSEKEWIKEHKYSEG